MNPAGEVIARTRKVHIPQFSYYHEDRYFAAGNTGFPVVEVAGARFGFPTCWDQWNPELARIYALEGAEVLVYPTAIGSEPDLGDFDTQPLWRHMITANGLANGTYMVAVNRIGTEGPLTFYGPRRGAPGRADGVGSRPGSGPRPGLVDVWIVRYPSSRSIRAADRGGKGNRLTRVPPARLPIPR